MAKSRIDPTLPSSRLSAAIMAQRGFFELMYAVTQGTNSAKVFFVLYDTAKAYPSGLSVSEIAERSGLEHSMASQALLQLDKKGFIERKRQGQEVYSWIKDSYRLYFDDFTVRHEDKVTSEETWGKKDTKDLVAEKSGARRARS